MTNLLTKTLTELSKGLNNKEFSSNEIFLTYENSINKSKNLNAYITLTLDIAKNQALESDKRREQGQAKSNLDGIPLGIKDIYLTKGIKTTNASNFLSNFIPPYESSITNKLINEDGMVILGKLNMDEFAMGSTNTTSYFKPVISPWKGKDNQDYIPGGSSGGSAAAVSGYIAPAALGTDTGGSIRQPAAFTGIVGMKPTYGLCSRYGIIAFASSLDQAGPMTRTVEDNALLLTHMAFYDNKDSTQIKNQSKDYTKELNKSIKGLKIGIPKEYYSEKLDKEILKTWQKTQDILKSLGAEIIEISLPHTEYALPVYYIISPSEASSNLARYDGIRYGNRSNGETLEDVYKKSRKDGWQEEVKRRIMIGTYNLMEENYHNFIKAAKVRNLIAKDFINAYKLVDIILTPTTPTEATKLNEMPTDPIAVYYSDIFTVPANLAGIPALSMPISISQNNLPLSIQLMGNYFTESLMYNVANLIEKEIGLNFISDHAKSLIV
jgi:aspartyl-tRNA(Asn)/glutamyl-tRNA(Gln) amidotransferase subunit A